MPRPDPDDWPRITDLSAVGPEDVKYRNTQFLTADEHPYETGLGHTETELRRQIWNVRNGDIRTVLRTFPTDEPLREQCALWMHAFVGKHFFPDANHRTAVALLRTLLSENKIAYEEWSVEHLKNTRKLSHDVRRDIEPVELDTLYRRDELYRLWRQFFQEELIVRFR